MNWRPSAGLDQLQKRAELLAAIRRFFADNKALEVDTPALMSAGSVDNHIESPRVDGGRHLHSSPELAMKRLLAAGSGDIYQLSHVYRANEQGRRHNPEFMLLEWYRCGFTTGDLQREISQLLNFITQLPWSDIPTLCVEYITYHQAFVQHCGLDPFSCSVDDIKQRCEGSLPALEDGDRDGWLDWLGSQLVFPHLGWRDGQLVQTFIVDFPASQAALARLTTDIRGYSVAARFELYIAGVELANGYHELSDVDEQRARLGKDAAFENPEFLAALESGLPDCSGVALGVDRLLMLMTSAHCIADIMPFSFDRI